MDFNEYSKEKFTNIDHSLDEHKKNINAIDLRLREMERLAMKIDNIADAVATTNLAVKELVQVLKTEYLQKDMYDKSEQLMSQRLKNSEEKIEEINNDTKKFRWLFYSAISIELVRILIGKAG